ncbi:RCC1 domain-containing protein [Amnibacterium flavum]|uniref:Fibronectin type-III domain-containing protein n=1 Tax=Amnibacterium flavum TaxID=2173173 RepID=A0A2V1HP30_9MICO|nr:RCC1 domain-containing protein [Amnibacterium flavum]PVZ94356.1 hypothetical protein DDQ50_11565 [Amnibacterium flavum]
MARFARSSAQQRRRTWLRRAGFAALALVVMIPIGIGSTGAYFTDAQNNAASASSASIASPTGLAVQRTSANIYASASWNGLAADSPLRNSQLGDRAVSYLLERSSTAEFANPVTVYSGTGTSTPDAGKSAATKMINQTLAVGPTAESAVCAINAFRGLSCWGAGSRGQLGNGSTNASATPVSVGGGLSEVATVAVGDRFGCAVNGDAVYCWGRNDFGQLGDNTRTDRSTPVRVQGLPTGQVPQILSVGYDSACVVLEEMWCWGRGDRGQLATGNANNQLTAVRAGALGDLPISAVAMGVNHTCVLSEGAVYCVGANKLGQRGNGTVQGASEADSMAVTRVTGLGGQQALAAGPYQTCSAAATTISCWGENTLSQLAAPASASSSTAVTTSVTTAGSIQSISMSDGGGCVRLADSTAKCWGSNSNKQISSADTIVATPTSVAVTGTLQHIVRGGVVSCVVIAATIDGKAGSGITCWGTGASGQLGDGTSGTRGAPDAAKLIEHPAGAVKSMVKVVAHNYAMCVIVGTDATKQIGSARCMGVSSLMGTGYADDGAVHWTPETITLLGDTVTDISLSHGTHVCAVSDGLPYCWGQNPQGQIGVARATTAYSAYPRLVPLPGSGAVTQIVANDQTSCALKGTDVYCWGLGTSPTKLLSGATQISGMGEQYCAVTTAGKVTCWKGVTASFRLNTSISNARDVSVGDPGACAVTTAGVMYCWTTGSDTTASTPSKASGIAWSDVESGLLGKWCGRKTADGTVWCFLASGASNHQDVPGVSGASDTLQRIDITGAVTVSVPKPWSTGCVIVNVEKVVCSGSTWSQIVSAKQGSWSSTVIYPTVSKQNPTPSVSLGCATGAKLDTSDLTCSLRPGSTYYYRIKATESVAGWRSPASTTVTLPAAG